MTYGKFLSGVLKCTCCALAIAWAPQSLAQNKPSPVIQKESSKQDLEAIRRGLAKIERRQQKIRQEIAALDKDRTEINRALITTARRAQELEGEISDAEAGLKALEASQQKLRTSLQSKRALLSEVLAALERMSSKPPPALLVSPEDALSSVRSAILLGSVVPEVRREADTLFSELKTLNEVSQQITQQRERLTTKLNELAEDENRLTLLVDEKNGLVAVSRDALDAEQKRAAKMAQDAKSLEELIGGLEDEITSAAAAAKAARDADKRRSQQEAERLAKAQAALRKALRKRTRNSSEGIAALDSIAGDPGRIEPAIAFSAAHKLLPLPVRGELIHTFGSREPGSASLRNDSAYATRPNARVRSPADGWVVYAGPFRSFGQLIILNVGENYHIVMAGMARVNVSPGRFVLAGEPIGRMGSTQVAAVGNVDLGSNKPILYIEFRKDGKSINPAPWWVPQKDKGSENDS